MPRRLIKNEKLELDHRYWLPDFGQVFSLTSIDKIDDIEYYFLSNKEGTQVYTHPITEKDFYEFVPDDSFLCAKNIINNNVYYKGYEIKFWFYWRSNEDKYKNFRPFIEINGKRLIEDNMSYKVYATFENKIFKDCLIN